MRRPNKEDSSFPSTTGEMPEVFFALAFDRLCSTRERLRFLTVLTPSNAISSHLRSLSKVQNGFTICWESYTYCRQISCRRKRREFINDAHLTTLVLIADGNAVCRKG
jgi:hypothetical protein